MIGEALRRHLAAELKHEPELAAKAQLALIHAERNADRTGQSLSIDHETVDVWIGLIRSKTREVGAGQVDVGALFRAAKAEKADTKGIISIREPYESPIDRLELHNFTTKWSEGLEGELGKLAIDRDGIHPYLIRNIASRLGRYGFKKDQVEARLSEILVTTEEDVPISERAAAARSQQLAEYQRELSSRGHRAGTAALSLILFVDDAPRIRDDLGLGRISEAAAIRQLEERLRLPQGAIDRKDFVDFLHDSSQYGKQILDFDRNDPTSINYRATFQSFFQDYVVDRKVAAAPPPPWLAKGQIVLPKNYDGRVYQALSAAIDGVLTPGLDPILKNRHLIDRMSSAVEQLLNKDDPLVRQTATQMMERLGLVQDPHSRRLSFVTGYGKNPGGAADAGERAIKRFAFEILRVGASDPKVAEAIARAKTPEDLVVWFRDADGHPDSDARSQLLKRITHRNLGEGAQNSAFHEVETLLALTWGRASTMGEAMDEVVAHASQLVRFYEQKQHEEARKYLDSGSTIERNDDWFHLRERLEHAMIEHLGFGKTSDGFHFPQWDSQLERLVQALPESLRPPQGSQKNDVIEYVRSLPYDPRIFARYVR